LEVWHDAKTVAGEERVVYWSGPRLRVWLHPV
jgi:hypothetical protein